MFKLKSKITEEYYRRNIR